MVIQHDIRAFLIIIFIMYLTNNFFNDILHCHQSGSTSELIHNDSNMNLVRLKITKQIINHLCLRHKISRPDQWLPTEVISFVHMRQKVFNIQHPFYIIPRTGINRDTWISIFNDTLHHFFERGTDIQIDHIKTRCHHLFHSLTTEADNSFQNIIFLRNFSFVRQFQCMRKFIHRNIMILLGKVLIQKSGRTHQHRSNRMKQFLQKIDSRSGETAKCQCLLCWINLRHDLSKQQ